MFFRDVLSKPWHEIKNRDGFDDQFLVFMAIVMKSNKITVVRINTRSCNDWSAKITTNVLNHVLVQGWLITEFNMQPFIVTLAGQFFARGMTAIISRETIVIDNPVYTSLASARIYVLPGGFISVGVVIALVTLVAATLVLKFTRFGRNIYALGGNEMSAQLMGLPTKRTKILAYVVCGFCSALAGVVYSLIMLSGYPLHAVSMEMDAIASSVIGGTLMSGGVAFLPGTLLGVLIQGVIQTFITFQGTLSAWWTRIIIALLLCLFIVIQAVVSRSRQRLNSEH